MSNYYPHTPFEDFIYCLNGSKAFLNTPKVVDGDIHYLTAACADAMSGFKHQSKLMDKMGIYDAFDIVCRTAAQEAATRFNVPLGKTYQQIKKQIMK